MDENIFSALIGGVAGAILSLISSYVIAKLKIKQEIKLWDSDFAINYAKLLSTDPKAAAHLARQFSIGLIIVQNTEGNTMSKHFIPYQCKVSVGRSDRNDIVLSGYTVSRDHGIFFYRGNKVFFQDLSSKNPTLKNDVIIKKKCRLKSGDTIKIGDMSLEFQELI